MSRILPMLWAGFGALLALSASHDERLLGGAILVGLFASIGEVYRNDRP